MNTTFNLKRFFLLEKYKKQETGKHLLWSAGVVLGICILCMMYDINKGMSYYTEHTQANYFCRYILWYICIAPCLLEPSMTSTILPFICCCPLLLLRSSFTYG